MLRTNPAMAIVLAASAGPLAAAGTPQILWQVQVPGRALTNYVTAAPSGTVYVNSDERLMAIDPEGNVQWEVLNTSDREARPINVRADGSLVVGGLGFGQVTALNSDGSLMWAYTSTANRLLAGPSVGPNGDIYAVGNNLGPFSVDSTGAIRWIGEPFISTDLNNSPIIFDSSRFFVALSGFSTSKVLHVYDQDDGHEAWSTFSAGIPWNGHPALDPSGRVIGLRWQTWVQALEPDDGQLVWSAHHPGMANNLAWDPKVGTNGVVYTSDISGADLWAINPDGSTRWHLPHTTADFVQKLSVSPDDAVIVVQGLTQENGVNFGWFRGYDTADGALLWQIDLPNENGVSPIFPGFGVAFTPDGRTAYVTTSYFAPAGDYAYLYAIELEPSPPSIGDVNGDGTVGFLDLISLLSAWGPCPEPCPPSCAADVDGDCSVGISDLITVLAHWF